tara:strand:+ start:303 stop:482 length:180 start_codon:yes stop_codon:yes gene_type:complete
MLDFKSKSVIIVGMFLKKLIVRLRMWYADIRGHHGKRWNYEPSEWYMGQHKKKENKNDK